MGSVYITVRVTQFCSLSFPRSGSCPNLSDRDFDLNVHKVAEVILAQFEALVLRKGGELRANNASSGVTPSTPSEWHSLIRDRLCLSKIFSKYLNRRLFHPLRCNWANRAAKLITHLCAPSLVLVLFHHRRAGLEQNVSRHKDGWTPCTELIYFLFSQLSGIQKIEQKHAWAQLD